MTRSKRAPDGATDSAAQFAPSPRMRPTRTDALRVFVRAPVERAHLDTAPFGSSFGAAMSSSPRACRPASPTSMPKAASTWSRQPRARKVPSTHSPPVAWTAASLSPSRSSTATNPWPPSPSSTGVPRPRPNSPPPPAGAYPRTPSSFPSPKSVDDPPLPPAIPPHRWHPAGNDPPPARSNRHESIGHPDGPRPSRFRNS